MSKHKPCIGDYVMAQNYKAELAKVKKQLAIAVEALNWYDRLEKMLIGWKLATGQERGTAEKALCEIKELNKNGRLERQNNK